MCKPSYFKENYNCVGTDDCIICMWYNGEQCIRELLPEGDIKRIEKDLEDDSRGSR